MESDKKFVKARLIIADDEPFICSMLEHLIDFNTLPITLIGTFHDGVSLENGVRELHPDIVLTDISMPLQDGLEVIRKTREEGNLCRFIIISGYKQFEYAYNALKYNVDDYLLKPVEKSELNRVLSKICDELRDKEKINDNEKKQKHNYLIGHGVYNELRSGTMSLAEINKTFRTDFQNGYYRFINLKLDFTRDDKQRMEDISSVIKKLTNLGHNSLSAICDEIICSEQRDRITFLVNYNQNQETQFKKQLSDLFTRAKNIIELFDGFNITLCVSKSVDQPNLLAKSSFSVKRAEWLRMVHGINRIIYDEQVDDLPLGGFKTHVDNTLEPLRKAYMSMDSSQVQFLFGQLFLLPKPIICGTEFMSLIQDNINMLSQQFAVVTKDQSKADAVIEKLQKEIDSQINLRALEHTLAEQVAIYLQELTEYAKEKNARPILQACAFMESHLSDQISLETISAKVFLSPVYFSNLFKHEMGKSFSDYLTDLRIKKAKEYLRSSDWNITEIASAIGYSDARYFSKVFKKEVGIKPTDYRKIYG